jgi:hypothetical protein
MDKSLLTSINYLSEAGVMDAIKRGWNAFKTVKPDEQPEQKPDEEPERIKPEDDDDENALVTIGSELLGIDRSEVRVVLYLEHLELKYYYLVKGGGGKLVDALDDAEVEAIKKGGTTKLLKLAFLGNSFTYSKMMNAPAGMDRAVIINAPKALVDSLFQADTEAARPLLKKLFSHKLYVMTLNLKKAKHPEVITAMSAKTSASERAEHFNPHILENYPNYARYMTAIREYARSQKAASPEAQDEERISKLERKADLAARENSAKATMQGSVNNTQYVMDVLFGALSAEKAATSLLGAVASKRMSRIELERILRVMSTDSPLFKAKEVLDAIQKN